MHLTKNELKSLIKEALSAQINEATTATTDPLGGGLLGAGAAVTGVQSANAIQNLNLFLTAFGLAPQQTAPATPPQTASQKGQDGESWVGKSWRDVMGALKSEFNIRGSKGWYKKLPYNHDARVKYREWYTSRGK